MDIAKFKKLPIMGILRCYGDVPVEELIETVVSSGLGTIEITMNSDSAEALIKRAVKASRGRLAIGAGTVLTTDILKKALRAGATFIVSPTVDSDLINTCVKNAVPVFPGALTPQEIYNARRSGATMVKVFPAGAFGPSYLKYVKGPFPDIELLACGGITRENIKSYFASGASAVSFGASIFNKDNLINKNFALIERSIKELIANINGSGAGVNPGADGSPLARG